MGKIPTSIEPSVKRFIEEARQWRPIKEAYLYGSQAKGMASEWSDIDIAIISSDFSDDLFEERIALMHIAARIDDRIEPHPFLESTFNSTDPLSNEIQQHGIRIV
ncbi:MAG: nucleotidyltransferase domain-containing protein [Deltaproteobacteria bacterium]|nr:nucleotidyltransferase domain-containing protein [Deltaproteobacteria bacterium]